jgi:hypothetical protein
LTKLATFDVVNHERGSVQQLDLVDGVTDDHIAFIQREWTPRLADAKARAIVAFFALPLPQQTNDAWQGKLGEFGAPDAHWDWAGIRKSMLGSVHRMLALLDGDAVEALMRIDLSKASRIETTAITPLVYVDNLAAAPWNRSQIQVTPRYKGLGKVLLGAAVAISIDESMDGRSGLHSLVQAEKFYARAGMQDLGLDAAVESLRYFEFTPDAAKKFLET